MLSGAPAHYPVAMHKGQQSRQRQIQYQHRRRRLVRIVQDTLKDQGRDIYPALRFQHAALQSLQHLLFR